MTSLALEVILGLILGIAWIGLPCAFLAALIADWVHLNWGRKRFSDISEGPVDVPLRTELDNAVATPLEAQSREGREAAIHEA